MAILGAALSLNGTWEPVPRSRRAALARLASRPEAVLFAAPAEAAPFFERGEVSEVVVLWKAALKAGPDLPGLAAPFAPPAGKPRLSFRLEKIAPTSGGNGVLARYRPVFS